MIFREGVFLQEKIPAFPESGEQAQDLRVTEWRMYMKRRARRKERGRRQRKMLVPVAVLIFAAMVGKGVYNTGHFGGIPVSLMGAGSGFSPGAGYPDSLIQLARKNPETEEFVRNYPEKKDGRGRIDISGDLDGGIPLFLQWDERWGYRDYGGDFMALNGCGPTCLSMVCCGITGNTKWNPYRVAVMAEKGGYYVEGSGTAWSLMYDGAAKLGLRAEKVSFDEDSIFRTLRQGKPVICVVGPGDFTTQGHFLVLTGIDDSGKILLHDPNSRKRSGKSWELSELMPQIRDLWAYEAER